MAARKRDPSEESLEPQPKSREKPTTTNSITDLPPIAPSKKLSLIFFVPYSYLIFSHYNIDADLKRSIIINTVFSSVGFFVTVTLILVAFEFLSEGSNRLGCVV